MNEDEAAQLRELLATAASTGEIIVVSYAGGSEEGTKRRVVVLKVMNDSAHVREVGDATRKTYKLSRMKIVREDDDSLEWKDQKKKRELGLRVLPEIYFAQWCFDIHPALWAACGVRQGVYVDKEQTAKARTDAINRGMDRAEAARFRITQRAFTVKPKPEADFHQGDVFWSRDGATFLQVVAFKDLMEVHHGRVSVVNTLELPKRRAYHLTDELLLRWLETGLEPATSRIFPAESYSDLHRLVLLDPNENWDQF